MSEKYRKKGLYPIAAGAASLTAAAAAEVLLSSLSLSHKRPLWPGGGVGDQPTVTETAGQQQLQQQQLGEEQNPAH